LTGSGQRRFVRTAANIRNIEDLICSQEGVGTAWHQQEPKGDQSGNWYLSKFGAENSEERSEADGSAHRTPSTAASQPISGTSLVIFFVLNHTTFVSSTVLQETHTSCDQQSNPFQLVKP